MKKFLFAVMGVALLAACKESPQSTDCTAENPDLGGSIEAAADMDADDSEDYLYYYFFETDSLLQRETEKSLQDSSVVLDYAVLPFQTDSIYKYQIINTIDEMVFCLGKDSVEALILFHNRDFMDSLENRLSDVPFRVFTLNTIVRWEGEEF